MKRTLAQELKESGYELIHHYRDKRAGGRVRHKIDISLQFEAIRADQKLNPDVVSEIVHKYIPEAEASDIGTGRMIFIWLQPPGAEPKSVGTDYVTQKRRAYMALRKMELA